MVDLEVRGAINVIEACAQTYSMHKIVFASSLTAAIWRDNLSSEKDIDERSWSDQNLCRKLKVKLHHVFLVVIMLVGLLLDVKMGQHQFQFRDIQQIIVHC